MNPHNGYIMAMVGGRGDDAFNRAATSRTSTRFLYGETICIFAAIQSGKTPGSIVICRPLLHLVTGAQKL